MTGPLATTLALTLVLVGSGLAASSEASEPAEIAVTGLNEVCTHGGSFCSDQPDLMIVVPPDTVFWLHGGEAGSAPSWSPDGRQVAFAGLDGEIHVVEVSGGVPMNLTNDPAADWAPAWSPDGSQIAFASDRNGAPELYVMNADGSHPVRVTTGSELEGPVRLSTLTGRLTWSPDGAHLAFDCEVEAGNADICVVTVADGVIERLTDHPGTDVDPAWSPDGTRIAFASDRSGQLQLHVMQPDGSGAARIGTGIAGFQPAWSPDGTWIAFTRLYDPASGCDANVCMFVAKADGTRARLMPGDAYFGSGFEPAWKPTGTSFNEWPVATFTVTCSGRTCTFDASGSHDPDGSVASYAWTFGDGSAPGSGATVAHTYLAPGTHAVTLTVVDDGGTATSETRSVTVGADLSRMYVGDLDASTTAQPGSWTASVRIAVHRDSRRAVPSARVTGAWDDGTPGACTTNVNGRCTVSRSGVPKTTVDVAFTVTGVVHARLTYAAVDNRDPDGDSDGSRITVRRPSMHIGDLDAASTGQLNGWTASVTVSVRRDGGLSGVPSARVTGAWDDGTAGACTTNLNGRCTVSRSGVPKTTAILVFTVTGVVHARLTYAGDNVDPDGDSDGSGIIVTRPNLHIGDLDASSTAQAGSWTARVAITVHNRRNAGVASARVTGAWSDGTPGACTTNLNGRCAVLRSGLPTTTTSLTFTVADVAHARLTYSTADAHDPDGDSDGTGITVVMP